MLDESKVSITNEDEFADWCSRIDTRLDALKEAVAGAFELDFSTESLASLRNWILENLPHYNDVSTDDEHERIMQCAAYIGKTYIRVLGWEWRHIAEKDFMYSKHVVVLGRKDGEAAQCAPVCEVTALLLSGPRSKFCGHLLGLPQSRR